VKDAVVVITGASAGLGRATAREFGRYGAKVGLIARGIDGLEAAKREIESAGGRAIVLPLDVADANAIEDAAAAIEDEFGPIDIWVNNAMASVFSPVKEMKADEYKRVTEVTYLGVVYGTLAALRRMLPRDRGTIVQVGSALVFRSILLQSAYCAAKHAIAGHVQRLEEIFKSLDESPKGKKCAGIAKEINPQANEGTKQSGDRTAKPKRRKRAA
jgi:NADP-dependent 3-hydroxy acid dehydrogenase YdfG